MPAKIRSSSAGFAASSRVMRVKLRVWCTSVTSMPKALKVPGSRGMRMRPMPSSAMMRPAMVGPMPPNGTKVNSRGS